MKENIYTPKNFLLSMLFALPPNTFNEEQLNGDCIPQTQMMHLLTYYVLKGHDLRQI